MVPVVFLSTFWDVIWATLILFFIIIPLVMLWVFALMDLFTRRDIRWQKVVWLLFIVFIPLFGSIVSLLVRPQGADVPPRAPVEVAGS